MLNAGDSIQKSQALSNKELFKVHEVSILDLDKEGSLLNDMDSMDGQGKSKTKINLDGGESGEGTSKSTKRLLVNQPSEADDFQRASPQDGDNEE